MRLLFKDSQVFIDQNVNSITIGHFSNIHNAPPNEYFLQHNSSFFNENLVFHQHYQSFPEEKHNFFQHNQSFLEGNHNSL